jgi:hypothetical protein
LKAYDRLMCMIRKFSVAAFFLFLNIAAVYAQIGVDNPNPCGGGVDPDDQVPCEVPLDTWVYILIVTAAIYGFYQLCKKQKSLSV